mmetsp:Transcript_38574/g.28456  ORF Transcript_38574/g.28456 Transcript_38574/m.28456 type:complete len:99 (+) Transcript_38574:822-1118(+)
MGSGETCNELIVNSAGEDLNTGFKMALGLAFTFISLFVISSSTKGEHEENVAVKVNEMAMEQEGDNGERVDDIEVTGGKKLTQEEAHTFPISSGAIVF